MSRDPADATGGALAGADSPGRLDALLHTESLFVLLNGDTLGEVTGYWTQLAADGRVIQSLAPTPWGAPYGITFTSSPRTHRWTDPRRAPCRAWWRAFRQFGRPASGVRAPGP